MICPTLGRASLFGLLALAVALSLAGPATAEVRVQVRAEAPWNDSQLDVVAGETYVFKAEGDWVDWTIETDADGYKRWYMAPFGGLRRAPKAKWFALIGCVDKSLNHCFTIGRANQLKMPASGRLYLFANDVEHFYKNNRGSLQLTISQPIRAAAAMDPGALNDGRRVN